MASNHANPFAIQLPRRNGGGGGGSYEEVDQDFEAQDVLRGANKNHTATRNAKSNRSRNDEDESNTSDDDDDDEDYASIQRRRRRYMSTNIGDLYQRNNSGGQSLSFNLILFCLLGFLTIFGLGYYGLSRREQRQIHVNELHEQEEVDRLKEKYGLVEADKKSLLEEEEDIVQHQADNESAVDNSEEKKSHHEKNVPTSSKPAKSHHPENFDPFHLQQTKQNHNQQQINSHTNDWFGAPFIVSPPQIPSFISADGDENADGTSSSSAAAAYSGSRLGYFQYPTIVNNTLVFSSEGDLYLTRVPTTTNTDTTTTAASMPAMKLTTTVGNAIHPKLNHKYPHLLAYSATYSGVREVYLIDLRGITNGGATLMMGVPGTPGGPALRLTYTTGGITSVVGWDEDGTSILYSAWGDQVGMWDVRLYRLRLSSSGGAVKEDGANSTIEVAEAPASKGGEGKTVTKGGKAFTIEDAKSYADRVAAPDDTDHILDDKSGNKSNNNSSVEAIINKTETSHEKNMHKKKKKKKDDDDQQRKLKREQERQRRHAAKLLSSQSRRGVAGSTVHPIIEAVPLSQAVEGVYHSTTQKMSSSESSTASNSTECIYFTRVKQYSNTKRYVGGTAENLWSYCPGEFDDLAIPLTADYNGTSKSPQIYSHGGHEDWLFFMSDRAVYSTGSIGEAQTTEWIASSMDLWAAQLPVTSSGFSSTPTRLTNIACQYNGMELIEYSVDQSNGAVVLRVGADLNYMPTEAIKEKLYPTKKASGESQIHPLPIAVYSDFSHMQQRVIPLEVSDKALFDAYATPYGVSALLTTRGQTFVAPVVIPDQASIPKGNYGGGGRNMPPRRYKVAPGTGGEGMVRIMCAINIPLPTTGDDSGERFALVLATDPLSPTGEHAFYIIRTDAMASPSFGFAALYDMDTVEETGLPVPFLGGHLESGGSAKDGGLGTIYPETVVISQCGRRFAYANTDGRIVVATVPIHPKGDDEMLGRHLASVDMIVLPWENEIDQPMIGKRDRNLVFSPGGRYLAIEHSAKNQFKVISIADLGSPGKESLHLGRIVQVTPDRFNSFSAVWGRESKDFAVDEYASKLESGKKDPASDGGASALFFLSDRDINLTGATDPFGTRAPSPSFDGHSCVHILPLRSLKDSIEANEVNAFIQASFGGGGASEVSAEGIHELNLMLKAAELNEDGIGSLNTTAEEQHYVIDTPISFAKEKDIHFRFARNSYRVDSIPSGSYVKIVCQLSDDPSLAIVTRTPDNDWKLSLLATVDYPSDHIKEESLYDYDDGIDAVDMSTDGNYLLVLISGKLEVIPRIASEVLSLAKGTNIAAFGGLHVTVWPELEYQQMYADSWRLLRDYFYDAELHQIDWDEVFDRYLPLVERCGKREELDDVMRQMGGELSALHVFVTWGETASPNYYKSLESINEIASLGATLRRSTEMNGYELIEIPERDPDFHMIDGEPVSQIVFILIVLDLPLSHKQLLFFRCILLFLIKCFG